MKRLAAVLFLLAACTPAAKHPGADAAGNWAEALKPLPAGAETPTKFCTDGSDWCIDIVSGDNAQNYRVSHTPQGAAAQQIADIEFADSDTRSVWPTLVHAADNDHILIGITHTNSTGYSGGGASATTVSLYLLSIKTPVSTAPATVLTAPVAGAADIRACFSEADAAARRDACSDQYNFDGVLTLDPAGATAPRFILTTHASTFPGKRSRGEDSTLALPLTDADLTTVVDAACSFTRTYTAGADGQYAPDSPLPACSDYLEP